MSSTTSVPLPLPLLQRAQIAAPCHARWEDMTGDERSRHCGECNLKVHNVAGLTESEAEALLRSAFDDDGTQKQRLCMRIYRRADGTILTADCPVGLAALRARARRTVVRTAAALGITTFVATLAAAEQRSGVSVMGWQPFAAVAKLIGKQPPPAQVQTFTAGSICLPAPTTPSSPSPAPRPTGD